MISEDLHGTQARRAYEIGSHDEGHDRESEARGTGDLLGCKAPLPYKEGCEGFLAGFGRNVFFSRNEARCDSSRGVELN